MAGHAAIQKLLLTSSFDRLPPRGVYEKHCKGPEPYEHWIWECQPRLRAMVAFRWAHGAWGRRELCWTCCHAGSPIELERSMIGYAVEKTCTLEDLENRREVARSCENESCVGVLDRLLAERGGNESAGCVAP